MLAKNLSLMRAGLVVISVLFAVFERAFSESGVAPMDGSGKTGDMLGPFQLQLHWTPSSCWQGNCTYKDWCMQCEGFRCNNGDILWVEPCRYGQHLPDEQLFYWMKVPAKHITGGVTVSKTSRSANATVSSTWGQLRVRARVREDDVALNRFLCLQRVGERNYTLQDCVQARQQQWFHGLDMNVPFELYPPPLLSDPGVRNVDKCVNMHHHPRQYEEIIHTSCLKARQEQTNLWQVVTNIESLTTNRDNTTILIESPPGAPSFDEQGYYQLGSPRQNPRCRPEATCGPCQGHCISDDDCAGSLACFERNQFNPTESPPGCYGQGTPTIDYCYAKDGN